MYFVWEEDDEGECVFLCMKKGLGPTIVTCHKWNQMLKFRVYKLEYQCYLNHHFIEQFVEQPKYIKELSLG